MLASAPTPTHPATQEAAVGAAAMEQEQGEQGGLSSPLPITVAGAVAGPAPAVAAPAAAPAAAAVLLCDPRERVVHTEVCGWMDGMGWREGIH